MSNITILHNRKICTVLHEEAENELPNVEHGSESKWQKQILGLFRTF